MRKEKEVREKLGILNLDRLKKRKKKFLSIGFRNCQFNMIMRVPGKGMVGFCRHEGICSKVPNGVVVCNDDEKPKKCGKFKCKNTHKSVEEDFNNILRDPARCGNEYPKIAILIWFLQRFPRQSRMTRMGKSLKELMIALSRLIFFRWW